MKRSKNKWIPKLIIVIAAIAACGAVVLGINSALSSRTKTTKLGFENIGELATQSVYCTEVKVAEASIDLWGIEIPFTQSKYIYSYDMVIKAGFNFEEIDWDLDEKNAQITVYLPEVQILSNELDTDSFEVYHEQESAFRPIHLEENNQAIAEMKQQAEADAIANGLFDNARSNAETILKGFFSNAYDLKQYQISFVDKN